MNDQAQWRPAPHSELADQFSERAGAYNTHTAWVDDQRVLSEMLRPMAVLRDSANCLDLGGGTGKVAEAGSVRGGRWTVCDISPEMLERRSVGDAVVADVHSLPFDDETFDLVAARSLLSYVDIAQVLAEVRRVLRPEGFLCVAEKVLGVSEFDETDWLQDLTRTRNPLKSVLHSTAELAGRVRGAGFDVRGAVELQQIYPAKLDAWLSRSGTIDDQAQRRIESLLRNPPPSFVAAGFKIDGNFMQIPTSWAVIHGVPAVSHPSTNVVVTLVPVRLSEGRVEVYVQRRRAEPVGNPAQYNSLEFPQGHVEDGELIADAVRRELAEEAGLSVVSVYPSGDFADVVQVDHHLVETSRPVQVVKSSDDRTLLSMVYVAEVSEGTSLGSIDNRGFWVSAGSLEEFARSGEVFPLNVPVFRDISGWIGDVERWLVARRSRA